MAQVTAAGKAVLITGCDSRVGYTLSKQLDELVRQTLRYYCYHKIRIFISYFFIYSLRDLQFLLDSITKWKMKN